MLSSISAHVISPDFISCTLNKSTDDNLSTYMSVFIYSSTKYHYIAIAHLAIYP